MRTQVNLLPSTKQDKLKASRTRQLVITVGSVLLLAAIALPIVLFVSKSTQIVVLKRTQTQIDERMKQVEETPNIHTMLTVQADLASLPSLYSQRLLVSDLFSILPSVTPTDVKLSSQKISTDGSIEFTGTASSYAAVNKFFEALQRAGTKYDPNKVPDPNATGEFSDLVLLNVGGISGGQVSFSIKGKYSQKILADDSANQNQNGDTNGQ